MCLYSQRVAESRLLLAVCPVVFYTAASSYQPILGVGGGLSSLPRAGEWGLASGRTKGTPPSTRKGVCLGRKWKWCPFAGASETVLTAGAPGWSAH